MYTDQRQQFVGAGSLLVRPVAVSPARGSWRRARRPARPIVGGRRLREVAPVLFIEYDVTGEGQIELVALINAVEEDGQDPDGEAWLAWRAEHEDGGMGCVGVAPDDLKVMEQTEDPDALAAIVERIILADRATKEEMPS